MTDRLEALHHSADRLRAFVAGLDDAALSRSAYPTEWTVADVCSHLGSGAVIMERRLQDLLAGVDTGLGLHRRKVIVIPTSFACVRLKHDEVSLFAGPPGSHLHCRFVELVSDCDRASVFYNVVIG